MISAIATATANLQKEGEQAPPAGPGERQRTFKGPAFDGPAGSGREFYGQASKRHTAAKDIDDDEDNVQPAAPAPELDLPDEEIQKLVQRVFTFDLVGADSPWSRYFNLKPQEPDAAEEARQKQQQETPRNLWAAYRQSRFRRTVYATFSNPEHSKLAYWMSLFLLAIILLNTATFCVESVPHYEHTPVEDALTIVDYVCLGIFTIEFLVRLATCDQLWPFLKAPMNIIDFLAIFPFYIELMVVGPGGSGASQTRILRLIRLLRILRLLKMAKRFQNLQVVVDALVQSTDVLSMLTFLLLVLLVVFSTIIYYIESTQEGSPFDSIPATMWYTQVTLTTTGYGDMYPATNWGKFAAGVTMLCCMVTIALPISVIGGNFSNLWGEYKQIKDAAERSAEVWPNFKKLKDSLTQHQLVMEDIIECVKATQAGIDRDVVTLKEDLQRARLLYMTRSEQVKSVEWPAEMAELRNHIGGLKQRLAAANDHWDELQALMGIASLTQADDFVAKLERLHNANKNLRKWSEEGAYMVGDVHTLTADLQALKDYLKIPGKQ